MPLNNNNPYSKAAGAYGSTAAAVDPRMLEGQILLKAAAGLEDLARRIEKGENPSREDIGTTLTYNQKLWQLFVEDMRNPDHPLPQEIKNNIASLALFVFKRTQEILIDTQPHKFKALIDINRNIAAGLMKQQGLQQAAPQKPESAMPTDSLV